MKLSGEGQAVLIKYALIGIIGFVAYTQIKKSVNETIDLVKNIDLNPFDENGTLSGAGYIGRAVSYTVGKMAETISDPNSYKMQAGTLIASGYDKSHDAALAKLGVNIKNYRVWYPDPLGGSKMPAGTYQVKWGTNRITYYAPKTGLDVFRM